MHLRHVTARQATTALRLVAQTSWSAAIGLRFLCNHHSAAGQAATARAYASLLSTAHHTRPAILAILLAARKFPA